MLSETNKTTARQRAERQGAIMTYVYAVKKNCSSTWNIAETTCNMNERDFLHYIFNTPNVFGRIDKVRILEIID